MNANETSPKANARLNQIKGVCHALKIFLLLYLGCHLVLGNSILAFIRPIIYPIDESQRTYNWESCGRNYATLAEVPRLVILIELFCAGILAAISVAVYQLLLLYERGFIFSEKNIQLLRRIGFFAVSYGLFVALGGRLIWASQHFVFSWRLIMWEMLITILDMLYSPWIFGGFCLMVFSYIMDEGRKIQEEQELTV